MDYLLNVNGYHQSMGIEGGGATANKINRYKLQTPVKCTTPPRGLLQLNTTSTIQRFPMRHHCLPSLPITEAITIRRLSIRKGDAQKPRMLTRFPVLMPRRPIEVLADQLQEEKMSCNELHDNIHNINVKDYWTPPPATPHPPPAPMRSSVHPLCYSRTTQTHSSTTGPLDISITVTRHSQADHVTTRPQSTSRPSTNYRPIHTFEHSLVLPTKPPGSASDVESGNRSVRKNVIRPTSGLRQNIAPLSFNAMVTHQKQPITQNTRISGKRLLLT